MGVLRRRGMATGQPQHLSAGPAIIFCVFALGLMIAGVLSVSEGTSMIESDSSYQSLWFETRCRVDEVSAKNEAVHCPFRCNETTSCGDVREGMPQWKGGCSYPCCGYDWWVSAWKVTPLCGERYGAPECFEGRESQWVNENGEGEPLWLHWCSSSSKLMRLAVCNGSLSRSDAESGAESVAVVGSVVPCFFNEARTDMKLNPGDENQPGNQAVWGGVLSFVGSTLICGATCNVCAGMGLLFASRATKQVNHPQYGRTRRLARDDSDGD